jgi:hypothetical protein
VDKVEIAARSWHLVGCRRCLKKRTKGVGGIASTGEVVRMGCLCPDAPLRHDPTCEKATQQLQRQLAGDRLARVKPFREELESLINRHSMETFSNTPDFILADYVGRCLKAFDLATTARDDWYGSRRVPG